MREELTYDVIVIGAGAAGLMAAASVAEFAASDAPVSPKVLVIEKRPAPGQKLIRSGSGQCNFTHAGAIESFLSRYGDGGGVGERGRFVRKSLTSFTNADLVTWLERRGVPSVVTPTGKVFPRSMRATDLRDVLMSSARVSGVQMIFGDAAERIRRVESGPSYFELSTKSHRKYRSRAILITTGGFTYPGTGSEGDGYRMAESLGHTVVPPRVALTSIRTRDYTESWPDCAGISLRNVPVTVAANQRFRTSHQFTGDLLFTHRGLSGPVILEISRYLTVGDRLSVSLISGEYTEIMETFRRTGVADGVSRVRKFLSQIKVPERLAELIMSRSGLASDQTLSRLPRPQRQSLSQAILASEFEVTGFGGRGEAMVTAGGVNRREIRAQTMESRICPGLYFAGEVVDVDGDTGGYNLQFAFSSARLAIRNALRRESGTE
ncbi:MAG: aminoacetone oxidase family FAD-binding enzyme [Planctomycetia bacterium]|nr:aminoacetone oxidase family FAD-binding enzyme [Planctomycetia bacterium]